MLILEEIAYPDLYIWYHVFGEAGSLNDINILNKSSILGSVIQSVEQHAIGYIFWWMVFIRPILFSLIPSTIH
jgi:hypothetical protein